MAIKVLVRFRLQSLRWLVILVKKTREHPAAVPAAVQRCPGI